MTPPRGALFMAAAVLALAACGSSSGDGAPTCAGCEGALCSGACIDLSGAFRDQVQGALPATACVPPATLSGLATVCAGQSCGGATGCTIDLAWGPISLGRDTHQLTGSLQATSSVDVALTGGYTCSATVTASLDLSATAAFACAEGSETATFGTITATLTAGPSVTGCGELGAIVGTLGDTFASTVEDQAASALAQATSALTASCP